jgi:hypothetical protein
MSSVFATKAKIIKEYGFIDRNRSSSEVQTAL